jgi:hypothetical protein
MNANETQELVQKLAQKYGPEAYLTEIEVRMPHCQMALRGKVHEIDSPRAVLEGSYMELKAVQLAYKRIKAASPSLSEMAIDGYAPETLPGEIAYWNQKASQVA